MAPAAGVRLQLAEGSSHHSLEVLRISVSTHRVTGELRSLLRSFTLHVASLIASFPDIGTSLESKAVQFLQ